MRREDGTAADAPTEVKSDGTTLDALDDNTTGVIFSFLDPTDLYSSHLTCKRWNMLISSDRYQWRSTELLPFSQTFSDPKSFLKACKPEEKTRILAIVFNLSSALIKLYTKHGRGYCSINVIIKNKIALQAIVERVDEGYLSSQHPMRIKHITENAEQALELLEMGFDQTILTFGANGPASYISTLYKHREYLYKLWFEFDLPNIGDPTKGVTPTFIIKYAHPEHQKPYVEYSKEIYFLLVSGIKPQVVAHLFEHIGVSSASAVVVKGRINQGALFALSRKLDDDPLRHGQLSPLVRELTSEFKTVQDVENYAREAPNVTINENSVGFFSPSRHATQEQPLGPYADHWCSTNDPVTAACLIKSGM